MFDETEALKNDRAKAVAFRGHTFRSRTFDADPQAVYIQCTGCGFTYDPQYPPEAVSECPDMTKPNPVVGYKPFGTTSGYGTVPPF